MACHDLFAQSPLHGAVTVDQRGKAFAHDLAHRRIGAAFDLLLDNPRHYRDSRNIGAYKQIFQKVSREEVFRNSGIQFMDINSLSTQELRRMF